MLCNIVFFFHLSLALFLLILSFFPSLSLILFPSTFNVFLSSSLFRAFFSHFFFFLSLSFSRPLSLSFSYSFFRHSILIFQLPSFLSHFPSSSCIALSFHSLLRLLFLHIFLPFSFCLNPVLLIFFYRHVSLNTTYKEYIVIFFTHF